MGTSKIIPLTLDKACYLLLSQSTSTDLFATPVISYMVFLDIPLFWGWEEEQSLEAQEEKETMKNKDL